jgi:SAM-dependent methyltransferase
MNKDNNQETPVESWGQYFEQRARRFDNPMIALDYLTARGVLEDRVIDSMVSYIAQRLGLNLRESFLEIGCGCGLIMKKLRGMGSLGDHCLGIDIAPTMIERAKKILPGTRFEVLDATEVAGLNLKFEKVLIWAALHYFNAQADVDKTLKAVVDLLRPGGRALLGWLPDQAVKEDYITWRKSVVYNQDLSRFTVNKSPNLSFLWFDKNYFLALADAFSVRVTLLNHKDIPIEVNRFFFSVLLERIP